MPAEIVIPGNYTEFITATHGAEGVQWLKQLPTTVTECAEQWDLDITHSPGKLTSNFIGYARTSDGTGRVLKIFPPNSEFQTEADALTVFNGHGAVKLYDTDKTKQALLLEKIEPGTQLADILTEGYFRDAEKMDETATSIIASVMNDLHQHQQPLPENHSFPTVAALVKKFISNNERYKYLAKRGPSAKGLYPGRLTPGLIDHAVDLFQELHETPTEQVLLHADLHHGNVLRSHRKPGGRAVDPKGAIGDKEYDAATMLRNPGRFLVLQHLGRWKGILRRRIDQISEVSGLDKERVLKYGIAQTVLIACRLHEENLTAGDFPAWYPVVTAEFLCSLEQ